jgi:non-haem Fe2+, alpha-ketoglutarate-dependent halogenase
MPEPQPSRDLDPEFVALHRTITERNARILYRGTDVASYNEPKALAQRG